MPARSARPPLVRLCLYASILYVLVAASFFWWRGVPAPPAPSVAIAGPSDSLVITDMHSAPLCLTTHMPHTLLLEIPFTRSDIGALEATISLWEFSWPCYTLRQPSRPDLVVGFNGNISEASNAGLRAQLDALLARRVVRECFGRVSVESAYLSGVADTYDKRRRSANWTVGPNNLFVHFLELAARRGYRYMAQLEPDVIPVRPLWLEELHCLASTSSAWVVGSPFLGQCAHDAHSARCEALGESIKFHLNGNALYAVGDLAFRAYWARAFAGKLSLWPFDLALHLYMQALPTTAQRRLAAKFQAHPVILNFGAEELTASSAAAAAAAAATASGGDESGGAVTLEADASAADDDSAVLAKGIAKGIVPNVRRASPHTYLVHSSWAMVQLRTHGASGYATMGLPMPGGADVATPASMVDALTGGGGAASDEVAGGHVLEGGTDSLISLARRRTDGDGRLILTFATALYDPLCRNFIAHLRRLGVRHYLLATFTRSYHAALTERGESPYLHELPGLTSNGSDVFASRDFFLVNAARYAVLTRLLRAGVHVFACDLDVALLRDPLPSVWALPYDLLLQSDARDAASLSESSPFLLRDRLHLPLATTGVTYVNGGVFFARGTHAVARLFSDTWALASQDLGTLNEQDCLNRMLLASSLRWAPLPPRLFPNGYVYFRRPLPPSSFVDEGEGDDATVLVHCNWINGITAKRYLLREALVWAGEADDRTEGAVGDLSRGGRLLAYAVGSVARERTLGAQVRALCAALALAALSNRTLIMPVFHVLPGGRPPAAVHTTDFKSSVATLSLPDRAAAEARDAQAEGRRGFTYLFEYAPFLQHFPDHRESSALRWRTGQVLPPPEVLPLGAPVSVNEESVDGGDAAVGDDGARGDGHTDTGGDTEGGGVDRWLAARTHLPILHVSRLHKASIETLMDDATHRLAFEARLRLALQPAPELRVISHHIVTKVHAHLNHLSGARRPAFHAQARPAEGLRRLSGQQPSSRKLLGVDSSAGKIGGSSVSGVHDFNCLHVTAAELASPNRLRFAAGSLPLDVPTLVIRELTASDMQASPLMSAGGGGSRDGNASATGEHGWMRAPLPPAVTKVFTTPLQVSQFFPYWDAVEVSDAAAGPTLAFDLIQQLVCSAAWRVHGHAGSEFVHGVCHWRHAGLAGRLLGARRGGALAADDVCSTLWEA